MKKQYAIGLLSAIIFLPTLIISILFGYEEKFLWNFHTGQYISIKSLFSIAICKKEEYNDFLLQFFSENERKQMPNHWLPLGVGYYNCHFQYRIEPRIAMDIMKSMEMLTKFPEKFMQGEKEIFKEKIINIVNIVSKNCVNAEWEIVILKNEISNIIKER